MRDGAEKAVKNVVEGYAGGYAGGDMSGHASAQAAPAQKAKRWEDCGIEEKLDRTREALIVLIGQQKIIGPIATDARHLARNHGHGPVGVMKPLFDNLYNESEYSHGPMNHLISLLA